MSKTILLIGAFDTKGTDYDFVRSEIARGRAILPAIPAAAPPA